MWLRVCINVIPAKYGRKLSLFCLQECSFNIVTSLLRNTEALNILFKLYILIILISPTKKEPEPNSCLRFKYTELAGITVDWTHESVVHTDKTVSNTIKQTITMFALQTKEKQKLSLCHHSRHVGNRQQNKAVQRLLEHCQLSWAQFSHSRTSTHNRLFWTEESQECGVH